MGVQHQRLMKKCAICESVTEFAFLKRGKHFDISYELRRCNNCKFLFVANPSTDYENIYNEDYYKGKGADCLIDYYHELEYPSETIRCYEWSGVFELVKNLIQINSKTEWLDYGCGNGGLVRYLKQNGVDRCVGFDEGKIVPISKEKGIPIISREVLHKEENKYNVITAIEVFEHIENPVDTLKQIKKLLKPGGLLFYTTGNSKPYRNKLDKWSYIIPEIHISMFEPSTLEMAINKAGLTAENPSLDTNLWEPIIKYKVLKNLGFKSRSLMESMIPVKPFSRIINHFYGISHHPVARKPLI